MNFEGLGVFFRLFRSISARWELTSQRTWLARQSQPKKLHRAGPMGLAYRGAILRDLPSFHRRIRRRGSFAASKKVESMLKLA
jgi:hypothetical protein